MGVGKAAATEIWHRVGLAPDHIIEDPVANILERRAHAENIVIAADNPEGAGGFQHAFRGGQPGLGETVISGQIIKPVPGLINPINPAMIRARQLPTQLQIIGRVGKHHIHRVGGHGVHRFNAIAEGDLVQPWFQIGAL